jgi:sugar/nucleoside kinase (ribokinase family)
MIVDRLYPVERLPGPGELTTIFDRITRATGGALCNVIGDLAIMDPDLPLTALGRVGADEEGDFILDSLRCYPNINLAQIKREGKTSFTAVMHDVTSNERTFFQFRGANAVFCEADIDWNKINAALLHIGYILLLDALDKEDDEYGTAMAQLLHHAQAHGIKTSVDVVTEAGDRFKRLVPPALKYTDYCVINEVEAAQVTGIALRDKNGNLRNANIPKALSYMKRYGVSTWAVIHAPEGGYGLDEEDNYIEAPSLDLPDGYIKGKVGAGDAFCAGVLYAAYKNETLDSALKLGNAAAAASLSKAGATDGMKRVDELRNFRVIE